MKIVSLPALPKVNELVKSPAVKSRAFQYIKAVVSDPLDLSLGVMWTAYVVSSLYEISVDFLGNQKSTIMRMSQKKVIQNQKFISKFFAVANIFKWIDWAGKSKVTGIKEYAFPRLSAVADVFYIYIYDHECSSNITDGEYARKAAQHHLSNSKSKKYYQAIETREIANYISNYSYVCFSGMSAMVFFTNTTLVASAMTGTIAIYFLFLAISGVAGVAAEEIGVKNKNIHWIKGASKIGGKL